MKKLTKKLKLIIEYGGRTEEMNWLSRQIFFLIINTNFRMEKNREEIKTKESKIYIQSDSKVARHLK